MIITFSMSRVNYELFTPTQKDFMFFAFVCCDKPLNVRHIGKRP